MSHLAHDGQDRALGWVTDRTVGLVGGAGERGSDEDGVDQLTGAAGELFGGAADQLREDHARVAARAQQRRAGDRGDDLVAPNLVDRSPLGGAGEPIELLQHGPQGEDHVVAGIAIGDREHVQVVDLFATLLERRQTRFDQRPEADDARIRCACPAGRSLRGGHSAPSEL